MSKKRKKKRKNVTYIPLLEIDARYLRYLRPFGVLLGFSFLLILLVATFDVIAPWPLKFIIDNVIGGAPFTGPVGEFIVGVLGTDQRVQAAALGLVLLLITVMQGVTTFAYEYLNGMIQERATLLLQSNVFRHVQSLPLQFFDQTRLGDLLQRVTEDSSKIIVALVGSMGDFIINAVKFIGFAGVMLFVNWRFSIIVLAYVPLLFVLYSTFRRNIRETAREARAQEGEMMNLTLETLGSIREVKAFGRETDQAAEFDTHGRRRVRSALRSVRWEASFSPVIDFIQAASTAAVLWYGVSQVLVGQFSVGELVIFMSYLKDIYQPLRRFSKISIKLQKAAASGDRLGKIFDAERGIADAPDAVSTGRLRGAVTFQNVDFAYPSAPEKSILSQVSFRTRPGQVVALVGGTGAGKSTLVSLLMRFYDVTGGHIAIDGLDVRHISLASLRTQFAIVPQESVLFSRSIRENIAYGRPDAAEEEIVAAARAANAHEFILRLSDGYDTVVGERGSTLSGGQRQRIAIARALLRDAPILILDEPTAALDAAAEDQVMGALERLMRGRTTFIVAHRLSTIRDADQIVVLDQGQVREIGTHAELIRRRGQYAHLVELQMGSGALIQPAPEVEAAAPMPVVAAGS